LSSLIKRYPDDGDYIRSKCRISKSTYFRLKRRKHVDDFTEENEICEETNKNEISNEAKTWIRKWISPPQPPLTIAKIQKWTKDEINEEVPKSRLKRFIKEECKYSYKKGSGRPRKIRKESHKSSKSLFWSKLLKQIYQGKTIVNIDEWGFSKEVKCNYSWLPRGEGNSILNSTWKGSWNLILAIFSDGEWIAMIKEKSTKGFDYSLFLAILVEFTKQNGVNLSEDLIILQDNASIHHSKKVKRFANSEKLKMYFLPSYCPELAPVELMFGWIKAKIRAVYSEEGLNFSEESGKSTICSILGSISKESRQKIWIKEIREARKCILE
jgi:transposase